MGLALGNILRVAEKLDVFEVTFQITPSGSYPGTPDTLNLAGMAGVPSNSLPDWVDIFEQPLSGQTPSGCLYNWCQGTTQANGKVWVGVSGGSGLPHAQAGNVTYASLGIGSNQNLIGIAQFSKFN